jgi:hypothetical protein
MKKFLLPLASIAMIAAPMIAQAATCRDAHGRFTACTGAAAKPAAAAPKAAKPKSETRAAVAAANTNAGKAQPKRCKINGRFASCSAPGAKPA